MNVERRGFVESRRSSRVKALFTQYHSALTYSKADSRRLCHSPSRHSIMTRFRTKRSNIQALKVKWTNEMHEKRTALGIFSSVLSFTDLVEFFLDMANR